MKVEWWVVRVLLHKGTRSAAKINQMDLIDQAVAIVGLRNGSYGQLPDGSIFEPLECWECTGELSAMTEAQEHAHELQQRLQRDNPTHDYRVVMNADGV